MKIEAKWHSGMHFSSNTPSHHTIHMDSGPKDSVTSGPTPMEMLLQGIAACSGMDIVAILEKKRKTPDLFEIRVEGERADTHPKVFTKIDILYRFKGEDLTEMDVMKAVKLSVDKYCSIIGMVRSTAEINWDIELIK